jgi:hypothetical protein
MTMMTDGLKALGKDETHEVKELTEVLAGKVVLLIKVFQHL